MTGTLRERIIAHLGRDLNRLYSISDIAKALGAAYSHCNKFIRELAEDNIIKLIKISNSLICTLNLKEPLTIANLALIEYQNYNVWKKNKNNKPKAAKLNLFLNRVKDHMIQIDSLIISKTNILILVNEIDGKLKNEIDKANLGISYMLIDRSNFYKMQENILNDHVVAYGAEKFWQYVKKEIKLE